MERSPELGENSQAAITERLIFDSLLMSSWRDSRLSAIINGGFEDEDQKTHFVRCRLLINLFMTRWSGYPDHESTVMTAR